MKMFNKPRWLKPEIDEPKYWIHLYILAAVALFFLENADAFLSFDLSLIHLWGTMFNIKNIFVSSWLLLAGDIVAHTILRLD